MWAETESWELRKWVCWARRERGRLRLAEEGYLAGSGCCLRGQKVLSEVAVAVAAAVGLVAEVVAAVVVVQVDADVAAPHC